VTLEDLDIARVRAGNPGPLTLSGTNTWVVGRDPAWVIDPGPLLDDHVDAVVSEVQARGGAGGIAITHTHEDHVEAAEALGERLGVAPGRGPGPFEVLPVPGHADDHVVYVWRRAAFTGDAVLGEGSVFVSGRLNEYLAGLRALRALDLVVLCPGHGDEVWDPAGKLDQYLAHRADRERMLVAALERGVRGEEALLDAAWADAPAAVRPFAAVSLRAHLEKLREDGFPVG
jgi:glyoxylase-like metal-dependent hydrolase (beta-lactamase superfamily II)